VLAAAARRCARWLDQVFKSAEALSTMETRDVARQDAFDYIEMFYNPKRKHTKNGVLSPVDFETRQKKLNEAGVQETRGTSQQMACLVQRRRSACTSDSAHRCAPSMQVLDVAGG
jgi:Integrase core domain